MLNQLPTILNCLVNHRRSLFIASISMCLTGAMISTLGSLSQGACSTASVVKMYISFNSLLKLDLMIQASFEFRSFFQYTETFKKRQIFSVGIRSFLISLSDWQSLHISSITGFLIQNPFGSIQASWFLVFSFISNLPKSLYSHVLR